MAGSHHDCIAEKSVDLRSPGHEHSRMQWRIVCTKHLYIESIILLCTYTCIYIWTLDFAHSSSTLCTASISPLLTFSSLTRCAGPSLKWASLIGMIVLELVSPILLSLSPPPPSLAPAQGLLWSGGGMDKALTSLGLLFQPREPCSGEMLNPMGEAQPANCCRARTASNKLKRAEPCLQQRTL